MIGTTVSHYRVVDLPHARPGTVLWNRDAVDASIQHQRRAFELRERVSEYERFYITSHYYGNVTDEVQKYLDVLRVWHSTYPNDFTAPNNLAVIHLHANLYTDFVREVSGWAAYFGGDRADVDRELAAQGELGRRGVRMLWRPQDIDLVVALEFARAAAGAGELDTARKAYWDLPSRWAGADADFPLLLQVRAELASLGS